MVTKPAPGRPSVFLLFTRTPPASLPPRVKNIVYFDLETQKSADEVGGWDKISAPPTTAPRTKRLMKGFMVKLWTNWLSNWGWPGIDRKCA